MRKIKKFLTKSCKTFMTALPALALFVGVLASQSACLSYYYQPETPSAMDKYR